MAMNCTQARRFLYAFADGEMGVKENCDVLDHLKMCPSCARIVADQQALRGALRRQLDNEPVPVDLAVRLTAPNPARPFAAARALRWAIAAAILLAAGIGGYRLSRGGGSAENGNGAAGPIAAAGFIQVHRVCCEHGAAEHQSPDLPATLVGLREAASRKLGRDVGVVVPDFSRQGYQFESAGFCGVQKGKCGLHVIYRNPTSNVRLSFFAVPRCMFRCGAMCERKNRSYYTDTVQEGQTPYSVAGWQCPKGRGTYVACSELRESELLGVVESAQMAAGRPREVQRLAGAAP